jgi:hypothetical protein
MYDPEMKEQSQNWRHSGLPRSKSSSRRSHEANCWRLSSGTGMKLCLEKGATIMAKFCVALLDKLKQHMVLKYESNLLKGISFPQDIAASHKAANTHQKLSGFHFDTRPAYLILPVRTTASFLSSGTISSEESSVEEVNISCRWVVYSTTKIIFCGWVKEVICVWSSWGNV